VAYPLYFVDNTVMPSIGSSPKNIFFLTADAFGVLPPISKLTTAQAMYYFISGYTAKVAGTEAGIYEPKTTFSPCFGEAFLPLHPTAYARLLGRKLDERGVNVWLVNTGWTGGPYGIGKRMRLKYTRAMITAAMNGELDNIPYRRHAQFNLQMPAMCLGVPEHILDPRSTWADKDAYDEMANHLAREFAGNFEKYAGHCDPQVVNAGPGISIAV
jgi:phosphoenolpyruvate carboxykinase (ATP)